jgi:cyclohexyl-isocyanide hydratase
MKTVGVYIWQGMTALDAIGPQNILGFVPDFDVVTVATSRDVVVTDTKLRIVPDHDLASCPPVDILVVAGGIDPSTQMTDDDVMEWMRTTGASAAYVTSVCTGALILAEAGLLDGYRATTHWAYKTQLATYAVEVVDERVVTDRNRITGGGVTAGIDFALAIVSEVAGAEVAGGLQLMGEYDPQPPTPFGNPATAPAELVDAVRAQFEALSPRLTEFFAAKSA